MKPDHLAEKIKDPGYTRKTRKWLNQRFDLVDSEGYYIPNQSSYGFSTLAFRLEEYLRCFHLLNTLNSLDFETFLDAGSADGYFPELVRRVFNKNVTGADLSDRALVRAREMYRLRGICADIHAMPFTDKSFDVVMASEVIEHVVDPELAVRELARIAVRAVVISTPRARNQQIAQNHFESLDPGEPHAHIHYFSDEEIKRLCPPGFHSVHLSARSRCVTAALDRLACDDGRSFSQRQAYCDFTVKSADLSPESRKSVTSMLLDRYRKRPLWKKCAAKPFLIGNLFLLDDYICRHYPGSGFDHVAVFLRDPGSWTQSARVSRFDLIRMILGKFHVQPIKPVFP